MCSFLAMECYSFKRKERDGVNIIYRMIVIVVVEFLELGGVISDVISDRCEGG